MTRLPSLAALGAAALVAAASACTGAGSSGGADSSAASDSAAPAARRGARTASGSRDAKPGALASESGKPVAPRSALRLAAGAELTLRVRDSLSSKFNHTGDTVIATSAAAAVDEAGQTVIPAGAAFEGVITDISPSSGPRSQGRLAMTFSRVRYGGRTYPLEGRMVSADETSAGRGITTGTALKVGAGAAVGGVAGRIIGGNTTGALIGAAAGGAVVAHETRRLDVIVPRGGVVKIALTAPFQP